MGESRATSGSLSVVRRTVRSRRAVAVLVALGAVLCYNLLAIEVASADPYWTNAIEVPGLSALNQSLASPGPIVCTSSGDCVSGGSFTDKSLNQQAFLSQETNGVWSNPTEIAAALNVGGFATVTGISCPTSGNCTAVGNYNDNSSIEHAYVVNQVNRTWGFPTELPDFTTLSFEDASVINGLSCSSTTACVGIGQYSDHSTTVSQPIIFTETNGTWATPVEAPGASTFNTNGLTLITGFSCATATTCVVGGGVFNLTATNPYLNPFLIEEKNGVWGNMVAPPGVAALTRIPDAAVTGVSCGAAGDCAVGGFYYDAVGGSQAFILNEVGGVWGSATQLFSTQLLGSGLNNAVNGVDCPSAGNCALIGSYADSKGISQAFVDDETNHVWNPAIEVPGVQPLNNNAGASLMTISCSAVGDCSAGGSYTDANTNTQALLVNESSGTWTSAIEAPGSASLNKGGSATIAQVSCSVDGSCGVQGLYTDASKNTQLFVVNSSAVAPTTVSSVPRHVTAVDNGGVITVRWNAPAEIRAAPPVTSYTVVSLP